MKTNWWYDSGLAAQAAQELVWFVVMAGHTKRSLK